jgi:thiosulfate/3-mercaptopyruvate sulfurtransferase
MKGPISTAELASRLDDPGVVLIDVRPKAAFNGWRLQGEARGGHIRGAVPFPISWMGTMSPAKMEALLVSRGAAPEKSFIVYGYSRREADRLVGWLRERAYGDVRVYESGLGAWAADKDLPMERLTHYEKLVHPAWVRGRMDRIPQEADGGRGFALFHVSDGFLEGYARGHIPGALHLDTGALESAPGWNRLPPEELEAALVRLGITHDLTVVLYGHDAALTVGDDRPAGRAGQLAAARVAAILAYAGVNDVRLLDGGFGAWMAAGFPVEKGSRVPAPTRTFGVEIPANPGFFVDMDEVKDLLSDPEGLLVSVCSWPEFIGAHSPYPDIPARGRIPGAVWGGGGSDAYHMQAYRDVDNTMRSYHEIEAHWREVGILPDRRVVFYCGTGWRASEAFFCARLMGWERVGVYDGGLLEWSQDPDNPLETGAP